MEEALADGAPLEPAEPAELIETPDEPMVRAPAPAPEPKPEVPLVEVPPPRLAIVPAL